MYIIIPVLVFCVSIFRYLSSPKTPDVPYMLFDLSLAGILIFSFFKSNKLFSKIIVRHSVLFLFGFMFVYYQYPLEYVLGNINAISPLDKNYLSEYSKGLCISNMVLSSFLLGYISYRGIRSEKNTLYRNYQTIVSVSIVKYASLFCLLGFIITVDKNYLFGGYGKFSAGSVAGEFGKVLNSSLMAFFAIKSYNSKLIGNINDISKFYRAFKYPLLVIFVYIILITMTGSRSLSLRMLFIVLFSYIYVVRPSIGRFAIIVGAISLSFVVTLQSILRADKTMSVYTAAELMIATQSLSPSTVELASSVSTLHIATKNIPDRIDYDYGFTVIPEFLLAIPGGRTLFFKIFDIPDDMQASTVILTKLGLNTLDSYGLGSSSIADIYISFGVLGAVIFFALFGRLIKYIEIKTFYKDRCSLYMLAISLCFYSQMFYSNRESLFTVLLGLPYVLLFILFAYKYSSK